MKKTSKAKPKAKTKKAAKPAKKAAKKASTSSKAKATPKAAKAKAKAAKTATPKKTAKAATAKAKTNASTAASTNGKAAPWKTAPGGDDLDESWTETPDAETPAESASTLEQADLMVMDGMKVPAKAERDANVAASTADPKYAKARAAVLE